MKNRRRTDDEHIALERLVLICFPILCLHSLFVKAGSPVSIAKKDVTSTHLLVRNYDKVSRRSQDIKRESYSQSPRSRYHH
jgi:hypothetical protein